MRRLLCVLLLAGCMRAKPELPILNYHSVGGAADDYTVPVAAFEEQLDWLASHGFQTVSLNDLVDSRRRHAPLPDKAIILTFDDGKVDALGIVLPALRKRGMRASFFVVTSLVGRAGYLTWDGVRALADAGMEIGSHTATHPRLPDLSDERVQDELRESRLRLQAGLHRPVEALAYPYNSVRARIEEAARAAGYRVAVAGVEHGSADLLSLRRMPVNGLTRIEQFTAELAASQR
jgi:peptidoglycan/xylan/chitin deacetylase (PgdA/CDA1 family)